MFDCIDCDLDDYTLIAIFLTTPQPRNSDHTPGDAEKYENEPDMIKVVVQPSSRDDPMLPIRSHKTKARHAQVTIYTTPPSNSAGYLLVPHLSEIVLR